MNSSEPAGPAKIPDELERYSRQVLFESIGETGQRRLGAARVTLFGCGALGSIQAKINTTDYYVMLMSRHPATQAELAGFAAQTRTSLDDIDARPITIAEKAPCFAGTSGPGTTWQERPLGEKILLGIGFAGFCAIAVASGGFCAF